MYQATGMVSLQLGLSAALALIRLRAYAYTHDRRLRDVARDDVARRLRFDPAERTRLLELFQLQTDQGPCVDCFNTGRPGTVPDVRSAGRRPRFTAAAEVGFVSVHAIPMRLRTDVIGALNLFGVEPGTLDTDNLRAGKALADIATIGLLQQRTIRYRDALTDQLQTALNSRILIEQAKGVLAERLQVTPDQAFAVLRGTARNRNRNLSELALAIVDGTDQISGSEPNAAH